MIYRIRIFSSFCKSENCKDIYERLCEAHLMDDYGPQNEIYITNDDDYSHVIILNTAMPQLKSEISKDNVVGMAFEPPQYLGLTPEFVEYAQKSIGKYYIGDTSGLPEPFTEKYSHMWHITPLQYPPEKNKIMSLMVSEKKAMTGHSYRHELVKKILETNLPIDIYGRGCKYYSFMNMKDDRVKGEFAETEPYNNYMYHVCIENIQTPEYFSEKIMNPLLCSTVPVYLGCKNIDKYFPNNVIVLTGDIKIDMRTLREICTKPYQYKKNIDIEIVKSVIYLLKNLDNIYR